MAASKLDQADFMRLFVRHQHELRVFARAMLPTWTAVDDTLQEASVVMWKKLSQVEDEQGFLPWAKVIVRFEALRARRDAARDRLVLSEETLDLLTEEAMAEEAGELSREREALKSCLEKLTGDQRKLVMAASLRDGALKELAEQSNRSANSLYKVVGRLRAKLRICVEREFRTEGGAA